MGFTGCIGFIGFIGFVGCIGFYRVCRDHIRYCKCFEGFLG